MNKFSANSKNRLQSVDIRVQKIVNFALCIAFYKFGIDFGIPRDGGYREASRQNELFLAKKSKCDGYKYKSYHQTKMAVDAYAYFDNKAQWDIEALRMVSICMEIATEALYADELVYTWGGTFKSIIDGPHHEWREK